jgi:hypothetical protein
MRSSILGLVVGVLLFCGGCRYLWDGDYAAREETARQEALNAARPGRWVVASVVAAPLESTKASDALAHPAECKSRALLVDSQTGRSYVWGIAPDQTEAWLQVGTWNMNKPTGVNPSDPRITP